MIPGQKCDRLSAGSGRRRRRNCASIEGGASAHRYIRRRQHGCVVRLVRVGRSSDRRSIHRRKPIFLGLGQSVWTELWVRGEADSAKVMVIWRRLLIFKTSSRFTKPAAWKSGRFASSHWPFKRESLRRLSAVWINPRKDFTGWMARTYRAYRPKNRQKFGTRKLGMSFNDSTCWRTFPTATTSSCPCFMHNRRSAEKSSGSARTKLWRSSA